jgi:hypothetical protein
VVPQLDGHDRWWIEFALEHNSRLSGMSGSQNFGPLAVITLSLIVLVVTAIFAISVVGIWLLFRSRIRGLKSLNHDSDTPFSREVTEHTPNNSIGWIVQAARESALRESYIQRCNPRDVMDIHPRDLVQWEYGPNPYGGNLEVRKRSGVTGLGPDGFAYSMLPIGSGAIG